MTVVLTPMPLVFRVQAALGAMSESEVPHMSPRLADQFYADRVLRALESEGLRVIPQNDLEAISGTEERARCRQAVADRLEHLQSHGMKLLPFDILGAFEALDLEHPIR